MREIGTIKQVQIQRSSLKVGERPSRHYDPSPLLVVEGLLLTPGGAIGLKDDVHIIDVHHADHPDSRNAGPNATSFGFTSHYRAMRARFGDHLVDGCAGENILIDADQQLTLEVIAQQVAIQISSGEIVYLRHVMVAAPCVEFSQYAARTPNPLSSQQMKETLQFLDNGMRGFYATLDGQPQSVQPGDRVFVAEG
jgi:hypothetical protein